MKSVQRAHYNHIHNVMGSFFRGLASYFANEIFDETTEVVIGTYAKAVQHYQNRVKAGGSGEQHSPEWPFITLDPRLDMQPDDIAGRFLFHYPNFALMTAVKEWGPNIYEDDNVIITPALNRYKGSFEMTVWCRSVYEQLDYQILTHQFFGGLGRPIKPENIQGNFVIPDSFRTFNYVNGYTEETYALDWSTSKAETVLFETLNQDKFIFPFEISPMLTLQGCSDSATKYGGDELSDYRLTIEVEWESVIPTHMILVANMNPEDSVVMANIECDVSYVNNDPNTTPGFKEVAQICTTTENKFYHRDLVHDSTVTYVVTATDVATLDADERVDITLPVELADTEYLVMFHRSGRFAPMFKYILHDTQKDVVQLVPVELKSLLEENDVLTILLYKDVPED